MTWARSACAERHLFPNDLPIVSPATTNSASRAVTRLSKAATCHHEDTHYSNTPSWKSHIKRTHITNIPSWKRHITFIPTHTLLYLPPPLIHLIYSTYKQTNTLKSAGTLAPDNQYVLYTHSVRHPRALIPTLIHIYIHLLHTHEQSLPHSPTPTLTQCHLHTHTHTHSLSIHCLLSHTTSVNLIFNLRRKKRWNSVPVTSQDNNEIAF